MTHLSTPDEVAVWQLATRYAQALDDRDFAALGEVFAADAVMDFAHIGEVAGPESIGQICAQALAPLDASQHLVGSHVIEVDGDRATARCYFQAQHVRVGAEGGDNYLVAGTYRDEVARRSEGWRIVRRTQTVTWSDGNAGVLSVPAARN